MTASENLTAPVPEAGPAGPAEEAPIRRPNAVIAALAYAGIVVALMQSLVVPIIPALPRLLHSSPSDTAWAVTATLLGGAVATPVTGRLRDMYGKRRMLLFSLVVMVAGSVLCAVSTSLVPLLVGRTLQGLAAGVAPLGISIMRDVLPAERLVSANALMSASLGIGVALGLPAAAFIADHASWHVLFWVSAGAGAVALVLVLLLVPRSGARMGGRFDLVGVVGLSTALTSLLLAVSKGADWGWGSATTLTLFTASAVMLPLWALHELRTADPLVDVRISARRQVLLTNLASMAFGMALFTMSLVIPQLLQLPRATATAWASPCWTPAWSWPRTGW